jgi:hypothetical protein
MNEGIDKAADTVKGLGDIVRDALLWFQVNFAHAWAVLQQGNLHNGSIVQRVIAALAVITLGAFCAGLLWTLVRTVLVSMYSFALTIVAGLLALLFLSMLPH